MSFHSAFATAAMRLLQPSEEYNGSSFGGKSSNDSDNDDITAQGTDGSNSSTNTSGGGGGNDAYEFIAFLLWYVFLVLCCVIPTCCAYRRRRQVEARMAQQQTNMDRWQATNMFIVASTGSGFRQGGSHHEALLQAHRTKYLEQELKGTTMVRTYILLSEHEVLRARSALY
jgi:hypothetical protein